MTQVIWKKVLQAVGSQEVELPIDAEILCAREQFEEICVWFRCNPKGEKRKRTILIAGTGHVLLEVTGRYIGTGFLQSGQLVFHVFEGV